MLRIVNKILILTGLLFTGIYLSCDEYMGLSVDCSECYTIMPDSADITVYLTINHDYPFVPLTIYKDQVDDDRIEYTDTATSSPYCRYVPVDQYYSVKAEYTTNGKTTFAVDGDKLNIKHVTESCDLECWVITGGVMDVRLKFE
jgi:hypothetical protein